jgi:hypothetical protein
MTPDQSTEPTPATPTHGGSGVAAVAPCSALGCSSASVKLRRPSINTKDGWIEVSIRRERYTHYGTLHIDPAPLCALHLEEVIRRAFDFEPND